MDRTGKEERGILRERVLPKERYETEGYFNEKQWASYLFVIRAVIRNVPKGEKILEIGAGGGYVAMLLAKIGYTVETYDVNPNLEPTKVVDISSDAFSAEDIEKYGCVICTEVLEHIPFDKFEICIQNIHRLSRKWVFLTIPDAYEKQQIRFSLGRRTLRSPIFRTYVRKELVSIHFWELNHRPECSYEKVREILRKYFDIEQECDIPSNYYHHYYKLKIVKGEV